MLFAKVMKVLLHGFGKLFALLNDTFLTFPQFVERVLRQVAVHHEEVDALFVVQYAAYDFGKSTFPTPPFCEENPRKMGRCCLFSIMIIS